MLFLSLSACLSIYFHRVVSVFTLAMRVKEIFNVFLFYSIALSPFSLDYNNIIIINDRHRHHTIYSENKRSWAEWKPVQCRGRVLKIYLAATAGIFAPQSRHSMPMIIFASIRIYIYYEYISAVLNV